MPSTTGYIPEWLTVHSPLSTGHELMSIGTGVVDYEAINCDTAVEIGRGNEETSRLKIWRCPVSPLR